MESRGTQGALGILRVTLLCLALLQSTYVYGQEECTELFSGLKRASQSKDVKLESSLRKMREKLQYTKGVQTVLNQEILEKLGFDGAYFRHERTIFSNPKLDDETQLVLQHHESSHVSTVDQILKTPNDPRNALGIIFAREGKAINPNVPDGYKNAFMIDEVKAYFKSSKLQSQRARLAVEQGRDPSVAISRAAEAKNKSVKFAAVSEELLSHVREFLLTHLESEISSSALAYVNDDLRVGQISIEVPMQDGPPLLAMFPLPAEDGRIRNWRNQAIKMCEDGIVVVRTYLDQKQ